MVECPFCSPDDGEGDREEREPCHECGGEGSFECTGGKNPAAFLDGEAFDYLELAKHCLLARERRWSASEYLAESAVFIQAFEALTPAMERLVEEYRERERRKAERQVRDGERRN